MISSIECVTLKIQRKDFLLINKALKTQTPFCTKDYHQRSGGFRRSITYSHKTNVHPKRYNVKSMFFQDN